MRWISYSVCLCAVVVQISYSMPTLDENGMLHKETLRSIDDELGNPTAEATIREKRTIGVLRRIFPELSKTKTEEGAQDNALSEAASEVKEVRVPYVPSESDNDLQSAASEAEDNEEAESSNEEVSDDIDISESEENSRSKRLGVFGNLFGGGGGGSAGGGSGGGSGNFLFDIIRTAADSAARAAGSVYRLVAGTDNLGLSGYNNDLTVPTVAVAMVAPPPATASNPPPAAAAPAKPTTTLVAGSGATEQQDENANAPIAPAAGGDPAQPQPADDGYQAGIPGPITRLFVIANRGIANLIQDLILRLAQTSERIVNFKARLITAII